MSLCRGYKACQTQPLRSIESHKNIGDEAGASRMNGEQEDEADREELIWGERGQSEVETDREGVIYREKPGFRRLGAK